MATHSSILAWKIPWTEKTGGLQSGHKESDRTQQLSTYPCTSKQANGNMNWSTNLPLMKYYVIVLQREKLEEQS